VALPYAPSDIFRLPPGALDPENLRWFREDLAQISRREGLRRAPYFTSGITTSIHAGEIDVLFTHFYECKNFDAETKQCGIYETRPPICSGFPWYGNKPDPTKAMPPECGFLEDVGITPVEITAKI
jgi:Fe-S-cluster containining protein